MYQMYYVIALNNLSPEYFRNMFTIKGNIRNSQRHVVKVPKMNITLSMLAVSFLWA